MKMLKVFVTGLILLTILSGCEKNLPPISAIKVIDNADVTLKLGDKAQIASDTTFDVQYTVNDGELIISGNSDALVILPAEVYANINAITVDSNADIKSDEGIIINFPENLVINAGTNADFTLALNTSNLVVNASGNSDIKITGDTCVAVSLNASDDVDYEAYGLKAKDYTINVSGNADANIYATNSIVGNVKDEASVTYKGNPAEINVNVDSTATFQSDDNN